MTRNLSARRSSNTASRSTLREVWPLVLLTRDHEAIKRLFRAKELIAQLDEMEPGDARYDALVAALWPDWTPQRRAVK